MDILSPELAERLAAEADAADRFADWPAAMAALREAGVFAWPVATPHGGRGWGTVELLRGAEVIATRCLTTAFVLSQRDAAIRQLAKGPAHLQARYLPGLAAGESFVTVGLSQLTTSRLHHGPALRPPPRRPATDWTAKCRG